MCRVHPHEFGVIRLCRTFSIFIFTGEARCAGCLCTSSGWFKHIEPHRTFSNHIITEIAKCVEFYHMSSGWFDHTEPSLSTSLQGKHSSFSPRIPTGSNNSTAILYTVYCFAYVYVMYVRTCMCVQSYIICAYQHEY